MSQEVKASEGLFFYREKAFKQVLLILVGVVAFLLLAGVGWEILVNRPRRRKYLNRIYLISTKMCHQTSW